MNSETSASEQKIRKNDPEANFWTLLDLLSAPAVMLFFLATDFSNIHADFLLISGIFFIFGPVVTLIRHPLSNDKNVISLYFDLFLYEKFSRFSFIHRVCLLTLVILDTAGLVQILVFILIKLFA